MTRALGLAAFGAWLAWQATVPSPVHAVEPAELVVERLHSPLPLYTFDWENLWPRSFSSEDSFGCMSRVGFGDWHFVPADSSEHDEFWSRFSNYGVFHCAAILSTADERAGLDDAKWRYGFFVLLGKGRRAGAREWELWTIQEGIVPGSDYLLLAREAGGEGPIDTFRVLQQRCPSGKLLETEGLDIWNTRYCAINSREELLALARKMLRFPARGTITRMFRPEPDPEPHPDEEIEPEPGASDRPARSAAAPLG